MKWTSYSFPSGTGDLGYRMLQEARAGSRAAMEAFCAFAEQAVREGWAVKK